MGEQPPDKKTKALDFPHLPDLTAMPTGGHGQRAVRTPLPTWLLYQAGEGKVKGATHFFAGFQQIKKE